MPSRRLMILSCTIVAASLILFYFSVGSNLYTLPETTHTLPDLKTAAAIFESLDPQKNRSHTSLPSWCHKLEDFQRPEQEDGLAVQVSPTELMCRDPALKDIYGIPRLFHQSWKTNERTKNFLRWSRGCRKQHIDWEWILWTDDDNLRLVQTFFPWLEQAFMDLPGPIYRADLARNLYMYQFGGMYADLDTDCLRPTTALLSSYDIPTYDATKVPTKAVAGQHKFALLGLMGTNTDSIEGIPNAWMAASPSHSLFQLPLFSILEQSARYQGAKLGNAGYRWERPEVITGPVALRQAVIQHFLSGNETSDRVILLPGNIVYPYNWENTGDLLPVCSAQEKTFDEEVCKEKLNVTERGSIAITYWSHMRELFPSK